MGANDVCKEHGGVCGKMGSMEAKIDAMKESVDKAVNAIEGHIHEADKPGGVRERVSLLEAAVRIQREDQSVIKRGYWKACIVSAIIGGLIARLAPDIIFEMFAFIFKKLIG